MLERVLQDYASLGLSLKAHPVSFVRDRLERTGVTTAAALRDGDRFPHGRPASVAGVVLVSQRPSTAKGLFFVTLEDETGICNLIVRPEIFERHRDAARHATAVLAHGRVERASGVIHLVTSRLESIDGMIGELLTVSRHFC